MTTEKKSKPTDERLIAKVFSVNELTSYQEGTIVSRTILDKAEGTVTVFAFDKGERLSTHSAPFDAMVEVTDGNAIICIQDTEFEVRSGQRIIMPANTPHSVTAPEKFKMVLTMIRSKN